MRHLRSRTWHKTKHTRPRSGATTPPSSVLGRCTQETYLPYLKVPTSGGSRLKMPLLGLLSRLVSAPPQKPHLAQNEAHTAPQQRYSFLIGSTWPLRTGNTLTLPQSTNQWGLSTQNAPPRSPISQRSGFVSYVRRLITRLTTGDAASHALA